jgi:hypothetical protein
MNLQTTAIELEEPMQNELKTIETVTKPRKKRKE